MTKRKAKRSFLIDMVTVTAKDFYILTSPEPTWKKVMDWCIDQVNSLRFVVPVTAFLVTSLSQHLVMNGIQSLIPNVVAIG